MRYWKMLFALVCIFLAMTLSAIPAIAQEEAEADEGDSNELKFGGIGYPFTGPDTGFGVGASALYRDAFGKEGRDMDFSFSFTQREQQSFSLNWGEPYFLSERGRLKVSVGYSTEPGARFYGIGNTVDDDGLSNYSWQSYSLSTTYSYRWPRTDLGIFGLNLGFSAEYDDPDNGHVDDDEDNPPVREAYYDIYRSFHFDGAYHYVPSVTLYRDTRIDRFPLGGGRDEVIWPMKGGYEAIGYSRSDEAWGSDFSYQSASVDVRRYFPLYFEDTIMVVRGYVNIGDGNFPFYKLHSYGSGNDLRGYNGNRFLGRCATQYNIELRQAFFPDKELSLFDGVVKLRYPSIALFWDSARVYDEIDDMGEEWLEDYHYSWGYAFRFVISPTIVIKFEWAYSDEQSTFSANAGLPF